MKHLLTPTPITIRKSYFRTKCGLGDSYLDGSYFKPPTEKMKAEDVKTAVPNLTIMETRHKITMRDITKAIRAIETVVTYGASAIFVKQEIIEEQDLLIYLKQGWEFVKELSNGKILVHLRK